MKTLQEIKDELAVDLFYKDWADLYNECGCWDTKDVIGTMDTVAKRYAEEAIQTCADDYNDNSYFEDDENVILAVKDKLL